MRGLQKVLVVDSGDRSLDSALSAELAEMGFASVTAPFEATDDVLAIMPSPAAVVLQMPGKNSVAERARFLQLARRLKASLCDTGIPVILMGSTQGSGINLVLQSKLGMKVFANAEVIPPDVNIDGSVQACARGL